MNWVAIRALFERLPDGSYLCGADASPVWIRCTAHHDGWFEHVDGWGKLHRYPLVAIPPHDGPAADAGTEPNTSPRPRERFPRIPRYLRMLG
jgi:hypothetical protein